MNKRTRLTATLLIIILTITSIPPFGPLYTHTKAAWKENGYKITYQLQNQWSGNATIELTITNQKEEPMENWKLSFSYEPDITSMWNADYEKDNQTYTITPKSYNATIQGNSSITLGFTACQADNNFSEPEAYNFTYDGKEAGEASGNACPEEDGMVSGLTFPEEWKGLRYALFTAGEEDTSIKAGGITINGDVHTNQNFLYQGGTLTISGLLHTAGTSQISTADQGTSIGTKYQHGSPIDMPDITSQIKESIQKEGTIHEENLSYREPVIALNKPVYTKGSITVHTSQFVGEGILMAEEGIIYNTGSTATPDNSKLMLATEQGDITLNGTDITMNGVLYAPNGTVIINAGTMTLNGRIIAKQILFNGTNLTINSSDADYSMLPFLPDHEETKPDLTLTADGTYKVNRKVVLDAQGVTKQDIQKETINWEFIKDGETETTTDTAIDKETETQTHKELLFKKAGSYTVRLTVGTGEAARTAQTTLVILEDEAPVADFVVENYYLRNEKGTADITITDASYSPDGDTIAKRIWTIYYDVNNNKKFEETEAEIISSSNETQITYQTDKVGRYKVELTVQEAIEPTIPALLEEEAYQKGTTSEKQDSKKIFTVDNVAPNLEISLEKQKAADIVYTYGNASQEQLSLYEEAAKQLKQKLTDQGINAKVNAISSSTITAKDSFAWKEYEHPGYKDAYGAYRDHHIVAEGDNITMYGYCARGFRDFLYIAEEEKGSRTISFDLQRDQTDWHSMEGAGLLFNTQIDETADRINGFCLLVTQEGLQLIEIQNAWLSIFRNGGGGNTKQFGRLLRTFPLENLYDNHHLKIELDDKSVSVWDGDAKIVDSYLLPDTQKGHGYGLITSYKEHSCEQQSYFTFSNVIMSAISGKQLSDMLDDYAWRDGAARYVVHLSNESVEELKGEEAICDMAKVLIEKGVHFFGIGNETNQSQFQQLLFTGEISGSIYQESKLKTALSSIAQIIEAGAAAQDTSTDPFISNKDRIQYVSLYTDKEQDPLKTISFEYQYDPNIFTAGKGNKRYLTATTPIEQFELAGAYQIWAKAQDDPTKGNQALGSYCKWSGIKEMEKLLLVQSKPVANVEVTLTENPKDSTTCLTNVEYESYDPDYGKDDQSAIIEEHFYYKNTKDAGWTKGRLPKQLPIGETYLVKYQVKDQQRSFSDPAIAVVKTSSMMKWQEPEDNEAPKVYITLSKDKAEVGEQVQIDAWASDNIGVDTFTLKIDGKEVLNDYGRCYQTKDKEGEVTITATAKDISGNETTETRTIIFEDNRDYQAPVITITAPKSGNDIAAQTEIAGSITDDRELKSYKVYVRKQGSEDYILLKSGSEPVEDGTIALWDTTSLSEGVYELHISAEDMSGNIAHYGIAVEVIRLEEETGQPEEKGDEEAPYIEYKEVRLSKESNEVIISGTVTDNKELKEYTVTCRKEGEEEKTLFTGTQEVKEGVLVTIPAETLTEGTYTITTRAEDAEGNYSLRSMNFTYKQFSEGSSETDITLPSEPVKTEGEGSASSDAIKKPVLAITLNRLAAGINESILGIITAGEDIDKSTLTVTVTDEDGKEEVPEIKNQSISILTTKTGTLTFTVTAKNNQGETITADARCQVYDQTDKTKPTAKLITPEADAIISESTDIIGTAKDEKALSYYRLELAPKGSNDYITLKESTKQVEKAALGRLDTTTLSDGSYSLRLTVQDKGGNRVSVTRSIIIESGLKLGAMNVGFTDLKETVSGVDLSVTRSYNSQNKTSSDFGYGWTLGLSGIRVYKTNNFSEHWVMSKSGNLLSTRYTMAETARHDIIIRYEDGSSDRFQAVLDPAQQAFAPICSTRVSFVSATNKKRKLTIDGDNLALTSQSLGENYFFGDDEDTMFEPENFILTMEDNTKIYLNVDKGVTRIKDAHGNTVKVTQNGYEHSDGKGITFTRDEKNRIVKATDTAGNELHYAYNEAGDLISYTDKAGNKAEYSYDEEHNLIAIKDPMGIAVARNEYDESGRLVAIIDANGNRTEYDYQTDKDSQIVTDALGGISSYRYDKKGNILSETNALGSTTTYTYDKDGNRTSVTDANGNKTTYQYDEKGNQTRVIYPDKTEGISTYNNTNMVTSIRTLNRELCHISYDDTDNAGQLTDALGNQTDYTYNAKGNLRSVTDEIGTVKQFTYDKDGNVKTITDGNGTAASMTYDKDGNCLSVTTKEQTKQGEQTCTRSYTYDESGNQVTSTDPEGNVTTYAYDADGRKTAETDAKGRTTRYSYDEAGNQTGITYADGTSETFTYDALGNNITATARNGQIKTMEYDAIGNLTALTDELGNRTTYEYDAVGNLTKETKAGGAVTTYEYDSRNRNTKITDALGGETRYTYTENSQMETVTDALGGETRYTYDGNGNCTKTTYADGSSVQAAYDARGRRTSQTDALGNTTTYAYDGADQLIKVTDAMGNETRYTYDGTGSLTSVTDALGNQTTYEYDSNGRITRTTNAMGQTMTQEYDALGNITRQESYGRTVTKNTYDSNNRLAETTITGNGGEETETTSYQYNKLGQVTRVTDASGTITYSYDKHSRLSKKTDVNGITVSYSYDSLGRTAAVSTPYGTTSYEYDLLDRVSKVTDREGNVAGYTYDAIGNRKTAVYANGITTGYTYDACGRLTEEQVKNKNGETISHYRYQLDEGGNRTAIEETDSNGSETKTTYRYDKLNRITREEITKKTTKEGSTGTSRLTNEYAYDAVSNRTSKTVSIKGDIEAIADVSSGISEQAEGTTTYTYNSLNQLVTEHTGGETRTYSYNEEGSLIKTASVNPAGKQADYGYDVKQQLIRATLQQGSQAEIISYTYDYEGNRTGKAKDDTEYTRYINDTQGGTTQVLAETNEEGEEQTVYTRQGSELISMAGNGKLWYYISDGHQSTRALTNEEGSVTDTYSYDAWGSLLSKTGDTVNDYLYTGEQYNAETGLYYLRARYMDPATGTFISMDSYAGNNSDPVTLHKYLYANANPVMNVDPTGNYSVAECNASMALKPIAQQMYMNLLNKTLQTINSISTASADARRLYSLLQSQDFAGNLLLDQWLKDMIQGTLLNMMIGLACSPFYVTRGIMAGFGMTMWLNQFEADLNSGDQELILYDLMQAGSLLGSFCCKCFTGNTLVRTEEGFTRIDEIKVGDYVLAENVEAGKKEYKKVLKVYVKEATKLVHLKTDGTKDEDQTIDTTANHPFYVEGRGWVAAEDIEAGDRLHTEDGSVVVVTANNTEKLKKPVKVYNLEVEDYHTYYVTRDEVLVHNMYGGSPNSNNSYIKITAGKNVKAHYKEHKALLEKVLGKKYPKFKQSNNADEFLSDLTNMISDGTLKYVYKSTAQKGGEILNIYKGEGLVLAIKQNGEWVTLLEDGKGMAIQFEVFKILD